MVDVDPVQHVVEVAKGISEYGMLAIAAAAFVIMSLINYYYARKSNTEQNNRMNTMVDSVIKTQKEMLETIIELQRGFGIKIDSLHNKTDQLRETITSEEFNKVRIAIKHVFKSIIHEVCITIAQTKEDNNLENRNLIEERIRNKVINFYKSDCEDLSSFQYNGKRVGECMDPEWMTMVSDYCIASVFDELPYHRKQYLPHLYVMFEKFRLELLENLKKI